MWYIPWRGFMKNVMRVFSVVLLVMVGTVFAVGPAGLIVTLFKNGNVSGIVTSTEFWLWIILHTISLQHLFQLIRLSDVFIHYLVYVLSLWHLVLHLVYLLTHSTRYQRYGHTSLICILRQLQYGV